MKRNDNIDTPLLIIELYKVINTQEYFVNCFVDEILFSLLPSNTQVF